MNSEINVLKHTLYLLFFVVITLMLFFLLIIPSYRELKLSNIELAKEEVYTESVLATQKRYSDDYQKLNDEKKFKSVAFSVGYSIEKFQSYSNKNIENLEITELKSEDYLENFIKTTYKLRGAVSSPEHFYKFLSNLKKYENVIEVQYPIEFKMDSGKLWVSLIVSVCNDIKLKVEKKREKA